MGFKGYGTITHYPWFVIAPAAWHTVMVVWPKWWLNNYIYGVTLTFFVLF